MVINLEKGDSVGLGLQQVGIGLGWDPAEGSVDFDLDASAFLLGDNKKIPSEQFFVFYNNLKSGDGSVESSGDDTTGGSSDGDDDETLMVNLEAVDPRVTEILVTVSIHDYEARNQNFGQVRNSFMRIYDARSNEEICKYELDEDFSTETALEFGRLCRKGGAWEFEATGVGIEGGLQALVSRYA
jgi:tellurium resistance protein TerD